MRNKLFKWIWIILIILIPFLIFGRQFFFGGFIGDLGDDLVQNLPNKILEYNYLTSGHLPLWNPYIFMGMPFLADIQVGAFYLPNIISFFLFDHFFQSYNFLIILHLIIAQAGMYLFLREEGLNRPAAFLGGFAFAFSAGFMRKLPFINMIEILSLVPFFLFVLLKFIKQPKILWVFLGSLIFAFMIFAGHPPSIAYFLIISGTYIVAHLIYHRKFKIIFGFLLMIVFGVLLSAVQLLPFFTLLENSARSQLELKHFLEGSMSWPLVWEALTSWKVDHIDFSLYGGLLPLISFVFILFLVRLKTNYNHFILWIGLLVLISLFFVLGANNPLYQYVHQIPFFGNIRSPGRYGVVFNFGMSLSFAFVINWMLSKAKNWINIVVAVLAILLFIDLTLYTTRSFTFYSQETARANQYSQNTESVLKQMEKDDITFGKGRVMASLTMRPNTNLIEKIEFIHGYNPLVLQDYKDLFIYGYLFFEKTSYIYENIKFFSLFNLKYHVFPKSGEIEKQNFIEKNGFERLEASPEFILYRNINETDRIYSPERIFYVSSLEEVKNTILSTNFDTKKDATLLSKETEEIPLKVKPHKISNIKYDLQQIQLDTEGPGKGFIVVSDTYYPGWKAYIDNNKTEIFKTNGITRGIFVTAGKHQIKFIYQPDDFYLGFWISTITFISFILLLIFIKFFPCLNSEK